MAANPEGHRRLLDLLAGWMMYVGHAEDLGQVDQYMAELDKIYDLYQEIGQLEDPHGDELYFEIVHRLAYLILDGKLPVQK